MTKPTYEHAQTIEVTILMTVVKVSEKTNAIVDEPIEGRDEVLDEFSHIVAEGITNDTVMTDIMAGTDLFVTAVDGKLAFWKVVER